MVDVAALMVLVSLALTGPVTPEKALACTLVDALSIVRFRTAVEETRDVGFFAVAIGMVTGTSHLN